jgi:uncharacterized membrane protein YagU involved in acid resistance
MKAMVRGMLAGLAGTVLMTGVIYAGKLLGLLRTPPPKEITSRAAADAGAHPSGGDFSLAWVAAHFGIGAVLGAAYPWVRGAYPGTPAVAGSLYGLSVWFQAYVGILPSLGLYPDPAEDSTSREAVMVAAHLVYGATVGQVCGRD